MRSTKAQIPRYTQATIAVLLYPITYPTLTLTLTLPLTYPTLSPYYPIPTLSLGPEKHLASLALGIIKVFVHFSREAWALFATDKTKMFNCLTGPLTVLLF